MISDGGPDATRPMRSHSSANAACASSRVSPSTENTTVMRAVWRPAVIGGRETGGSALSGGGRTIRA
jgi:hypothetical protein